MCPRIKPCTKNSQNYQVRNTTIVMNSIDVQDTIRNDIIRERERSKELREIFQLTSLSLEMIHDNTLWHHLIHVTDPI
jgi:hypothetical protein